MQFILFNQNHTLLVDAEVNRHEYERIKNKLPPISKSQELTRAYSSGQSKNLKVDDNSCFDLTTHEDELFK